MNIAQQIDTKHEETPQEFRAHLGCSLIGEKCERKIWLGFRWAIKESFPGRILRLFRRGHLEEQTVIDDLRSIGMTVERLQERVEFGSHVGGSIDGVVDGMLLEIKTHADKSFVALKKDGVQKSKPLHDVQMQSYMKGLGLFKALYYAVNKNTDEIHTEIVDYDQAVADKYVERAKRIALSNGMPPPISTDPSWFECKFCSGHDLCHGNKLTKQVNCRTCAHSTATPEGAFVCEKYNVTLTTEQQKTGCQAHIIHPDLIDAKYTPTEFGVIWHTKHGDVANGIADAHIYESSEIVANLEACAKGIDGEFRKGFDSRVVG